MRPAELWGSECSTPFVRTNIEAAIKDVSQAISQAISEGNGQAHT